MKIIVSVKQVPDTSGKVAVNPDGTLNRASMQTIINPDDMNAVEAALKIKDATGCKVLVVTMGPPPAEGMLRELMAMGADDGYLVSAREFGGSDTYATSQILAAALDTIGLDDDDIVFCGRQAIDGDTAQVGPQIAEKLHLPQITYAADIKKEGEGFKIAMKTLDGGRIGIASQALGLAEGAINEAVKYTKERIQFGRRLSQFQNTQFQLADMHTRTQAAQYLVYAAAMKKQNHEDYSMDAAMAKLFAAETASDVTRRAVQLFGGYGYTREYPVERMMRDAKITEIYEGTSEVQRMVVAKYLGVN